MCQSNWYWNEQRKSHCEHEISGALRLVDSGAEETEAEAAASFMSWGDASEDDEEEPHEDIEVDRASGYIINVESVMCKRMPDALPPAAVTGFEDGVGLEACEEME